VNLLIASKTEGWYDEEVEHPLVALKKKTKGATRRWAPPRCVLLGASRDSVGLVCSQYVNFEKKGLGHTLYAHHLYSEFCPPQLLMLSLWPGRRWLEKVGGDVGGLRR
jgi:hypothetical protein